VTAGQLSFQLAVARPSR